MSGSLWPKEHGATAELAFPILTGLGLGVPSSAGVALALSAVAFYLAHEPLAVLLGVRGARIRGSLGGPARVRGTVFVGAGLIFAVTALAFDGGSLWPWILAPTSAAGLLIPLVLARKEKTLPGELLVILTFASLVLPLAAAGGADPGPAVAASLVWVVSFGLGTLEVHAIKTRTKRRPKGPWTGRLSTTAAALVVLGAAAALTLPIGPDPTPFLAVLPPALAIQGIGFMRVHPRNLKRVGWSLVGANTLALGILLVGALR